MTEKQKQVVRALAENNMVLRHAAKSLGLGDLTVREHVERIRSYTGLNPMNFYDLNELLKMTEEAVLYRCTCKICGRKFNAPNHQYRLCSDQCKAIAKERSDAKAKEKSWEYRQVQKENKKLRARAAQKQVERDLDEVGARKRPGPSVSLSDACSKARELGMTYGEYMTYLKERA